MIEVLREANVVVKDYGDLPTVPFTPDRGSPSRRNLGAVASVARDVAAAVARIDADGMFPFVVGGDCTITIGVLAGLAARSETLGLLYFDGDVDLHTPSTTSSGIFDGMGLAHILGKGARELCGIGPRVPLLEATQVAAVGYQEAWLDDAERAELTSAGIATFPRSAIDPPPQRAATAAVSGLERRVDRFLLHFDVDVVDHPDLPVADVAHFGGLPLEHADQCLATFLSSPAATAFVLTEFNALQDPTGELARGLVRRLGQRFAQRPLTAWPSLGNGAGSGPTPVRRDAP